MGWLIAIIWVMSGVMGLMVYALRFPLEDDRWYWPHYKPFTGWVLAVVCGPVFLLGSAAI